MYTSFALVRTGAILSVCLITKSKNPVHSIFYLVLTFLHCSGLLVFAGLEYFVLLQLLVYLGALAILFLFVVMLLDIKSAEIRAHQRGTYPVAAVFFFLLSFLVVVFFLSAPKRFSFFSSPDFFKKREIMQERKEGDLFPFDFNMEKTFAEKQQERNYINWSAQRRQTSLVTSLGVSLYGVHPDLLILASLLLLVAMVGAVGLTLKRPVAAPRYDVFRQHYADFKKTTIPRRRKN